MSSPRIGASSTPQIPPALAEFTPHLASLEDDASWSEIAVRDADLGGATTRGLTIERTHVAGVNLAESHLHQLHVTDATFRDCNFANMISSDASLGRVTFAESKCTGMHLTKARLVDVEFRGCRLDLTTFEAVRFKQVTFRDCFLRDADFTEASFDRTHFVDCDLSGATFSRTRVQESEMRDCKLAGIRGLESLRGIAMERGDIVENIDLFAAELGIRILPSGRRLDD